MLNETVVFVFVVIFVVARSSATNNKLVVIAVFRSSFEDEIRAGQRAQFAVEWVTTLLATGLHTQTHT